HSEQSHIRIEALYNLFAFDEPAAIAACVALERQCAAQDWFEVRHGLVLALGELTRTGWLTASSQADAMLTILESTSAREQSTALEQSVRDVVELARVSGHTAA